MKSIGNVLILLGVLLVLFIKLNLGKAGDLLQSIIFSIIGIVLVFSWKQFAVNISKYNFAKFGRPQELLIQVLFYAIGAVFIVGGIFSIFKIFK